MIAEQSKTKFTLVALPAEPLFSKLNALKNHFYSSGFRYSTKPYTSKVHVSLAEGIDYETNFSLLRTDVAHSLMDSKQVVVEAASISNEVRLPANGECEYLSNWIAVLFDDPILFGLSDKLIEFLSKKGISTTDDYIKEVKQVSSSHNKRAIGNHLNMCNFCRPEKSVEAANEILKILPKKIVFDRVALGYNSDIFLWEVKLKEILYALKK